MATEKKFIQKAFADFGIKEFLGKYLDRAGVSKVTVAKTPIATRITIEVQRPGIVVGKGGESITRVSRELKVRFGIENPQIEVVEVPVPSLDAKLVAERIGRQIELRGNVKQALRIALREIMDAGAVGAEIRVAGKIVGKGGKAKALTVRQGYLKKSGDTIKLVREGRYTAYPKAGAIGVSVKILPPGTKFDDKPSLLKLRALGKEMEAKKAAETALAQPSEAAVEANEEGAAQGGAENAPQQAEEKPVEGKAEVKVKTPKRNRRKKEKDAEGESGGVELPPEDGPAGEPAAE
ncbi:30S ribosomal protein S3 [Candidatus Micrarchaeota archaeon]|nr:30S ribosomal protein S3 [Candidatus Micrarchaeota archaeon]